ncbi:MAG: hypothetical protein ACTSVI_03525 [Promethearchaeota archaeon]
MLIIRCSRCKKKLFQYLKIGKGHVLRCYKKRIGTIYNLIFEDGYAKCTCGNVIGKDRENVIEMYKNTFYHTGSKL